MPMGYISKSRYRSSLLLLMLALLVSIVGAEPSLAQERVAALISADYLLSADQPATTLERPFAMSAFTMPADAKLPSNTFQGRLILASGQQATIRYYQDDYNFAAKPALTLNQLPALDIGLLQSGFDLIPLQRQIVAGQHPLWETIVGPGKVWQQATDQGYSRASLPFSLRERNANCTHNGVLTFLFRSDGSMSKVATQISSETCKYFKFDLSGVSLASYVPAVIENRQQLIAEYHQERSRRLPVKPIAELAVDYEAVDLSALGGRDIIPASDMTLYGLVIDGVNYVSSCQTRHGPYPYCDIMDLPSYSLAKTVFAGLGLMYLEKQHPGVSRKKIADYVPACSAELGWDKVSFENTVDMAAGFYQQIDDRLDEWSSVMDQQFFLVESHEDKINFACQSMPSKSPAGIDWVYHTSDTYILGAAISGFIEQLEKAPVDAFDYVYQSLWRPLQLSPANSNASRSYDDRRQPFFGYGLNFYRDDIARMAAAMNDSGSFLYHRVDAQMLDAALQRNDDDRGLIAGADDVRYNNGVWAKNLKDFLGCANDMWIPYMSAYGGISVVMLPNKTVYYYFSDAGKFTWRHAAKLSNQLRPFCRQAKLENNNNA